MFLEMVIKWAKEFKTDEGRDSENVAPSPPVPKKLKFSSVKSQYLARQSTAASGTGSSSSSKSVSNQMAAYLSYDHGELTVKKNGEIEEIDPFKFWSSVSSEFPALAKLARLVLSVPASSAPVERVFSHAGIIFKPHRRSMSDSKLSQLIYLKVNRLKGYAL